MYFFKSFDSYDTLLTHKKNFSIIQISRRNLFESYWMVTFHLFNLSSPKGAGLQQPPNSFRPGAQKRAAKG